MLRQNLNFFVVLILINNNIHVEGIRNIDKEDIDNANKLGYKIKLLGSSEIINQNISTRTPFFN